MVSCATRSVVGAEEDLLWFCIVSPEVNIWWKVLAYVLGLWFIYNGDEFCWCVQGIQSMCCVSWLQEKAVGAVFLSH